MRSFEEWYVDTYYTVHGLVPPKELFSRYEDVYLNNDVYRQNLAWNHRQTEVDEYKSVAENLDEMYVKEKLKNKALQKKLDAAIYLLPSIKAENDLWGCDQVERQIELLEQALKGEGQ